MHRIPLSSFLEEEPQHMSTAGLTETLTTRIAPLSILLLLIPAWVEADPVVDIEIPVDYVDMRGLAFGDGTLWVLLGDGTVAGIDPESGEETFRFTLPQSGSPMGLAFASGFLWVGDDLYGEVSHYTPDGHQQGVESLVC
jgi:hypothetical protein